MTGKSYMTYPSKGSDTTLYCEANSFAGYYMLWFDDLLTGESYILASIKIFCFCLLHFICFVLFCFVLFCFVLFPFLKIAQYGLETKRNRTKLRIHAKITMMILYLQNWLTERVFKVGSLKVILEQVLMRKTASRFFGRSV